MRYFYTIFTEIRNGLQEYTITSDLKRAIAARAQGIPVYVGFSEVFPGTRKF